MTTLNIRETLARTQNISIANMAGDRTNSAFMLSLNISSRLTEQLWAPVLTFGFRLGTEL